MTSLKTIQFDATPLAKLVRGARSRPLAAAYLASVDPGSATNLDALARDALKADPDEGSLALELLARALPPERRDEALSILAAMDRLPMAECWEARLRALRARAFLDGKSGVGHLEAILQEVRNEPRGESRDPFAEFAAHAAADHAAATGSADSGQLAVAAVAMLPKARGRDDLRGMVARKLALRNEDLPTTPALLDIAEAAARGLSHQEALFTLIQLAIAKARLGRPGDAKKDFARAAAILRSDEEPRDVGMRALLLRARAHAGFWDDAHAMLPKAKQGFMQAAEGLQELLATMEMVPPEMASAMPGHLTEGLAFFQLGFNTIVHSTLVNLASAGTADHPDARLYIDAAFELHLALGDPAASFRGALHLAESAAPTRTKEALARARAVLPHAGSPDALFDYCEALVRAAWTTREPSHLAEAASFIERAKATQAQRDEVALDLLARLALLAEDERRGITGVYS